MARTKFHSGQDFFKVPVLFLHSSYRAQDLEKSSQINSPQYYPGHQAASKLCPTSQCGTNRCKTFYASTPTSTVLTVFFDRTNILRTKTAAEPCIPVSVLPSWTTWYIASASKIVESTCRRIAHIYRFSFISFRTVLTQSLHTLKS